jgi:uncharacterized protein
MLSCDYIRFHFLDKKYFTRDVLSRIFTIVNDIKKFKVCGTGKRVLLKSKGWYPSMETKETQDRLLKELAGLDRLLISYSGGVAVLCLRYFHKRHSTIKSRDLLIS